MIIVGAGLAGTTAAETLRNEGFDGRVLLLGDESEQPYDHPPLSKGYLRRELQRDDTRLHPDGFYERRGIELRTGTFVRAIDVAAHQIRLENGDRLRYDSLLLATGSAPRRLDVPGGELPGVHYLRTLSDADQLRARLSPNTRLVVIGAGWMGCEVAASARQLGAEVTIIDAHTVPLQGALGADVGAMFRDIHRDHGTVILGNAHLVAIEGDKGVERVRTDDRVLECDLVVVGIGVRPRCELAAPAGIAVGNGILADRHLCASAPDVFVAGDVANAYHGFYREHLRVEHWASALHQGPVAARNMLGLRDSYERLPYFYSDQYDVSMEYVGLARSWDRIVLRGDPASREFMVFWLRGDRLVAGMNVNIWDVNDVIERLIRERTVVDPRTLADPAAPLDDVALAGGGRR
jgi:3-phenylpropionate/trans-cinnamate dioxygenase ferredoxin reductase subunit